MCDPFLLRRQLHIVPVEITEIVFPTARSRNHHVLELHRYRFQVELSRNALLRSVSVRYAAHISALVDFVSAAGPVDIIQDPGVIQGADKSFDEGLERFSERGLSFPRSCLLDSQDPSCRQGLSEDPL